MTPLKWNRPLLLTFILAGALRSATPCRADFEYFGRGIDYWKGHSSSDDVKKTPAVAPEQAPAGADSRSAADGKFPWSKYLDPNNKEFFREGDYTPPEPFMELVRNPTDYNLKMWFAYIDRKNELAERLEEKVQEYAAKNGAKVADPEKAELLARASAILRTVPDAKRFRFRMYFNSQCPHCKRMFGTLAVLQSKGFFVEARQIDSERELADVPFPTERATKEEIRSKKIESVPLLLVGDLKRKVVYRMVGYQSPEAVLTAIGKEGGAM
jgi:glutaredoxin